MAISHNNEREKLNKDEQNLISCDKIESINLLKGIKSRYILIDRFTYEGLDMVLLEYIRTWSSTNLELPGLHCLFIFIFLLTNNKTNFLEIDKICVLWSEDSNASRAQIIPSAPENPEALILSSDLDNTNLEAKILPQENLEIKNPAFNIVEGVEFTVACDVKNPLYGPVGAAFVYSPQKGATPDQVVELDNGLRNLDKVFQQHFNRSIALVSGAGAAGGLGAGCLVFLGARLIPGIDYVIESIGLEKEITAANYIITGEGGFDTQSLQGKVVGHIADLARKYNKKIYVICGESLIDDSDYTALGIAKVSSLVAFAHSKEEAISAPERFIPAAVKALF